MIVVSYLRFRIAGYCCHLKAMTKDQTGRCGLYWDVSHLKRVELLVKTGYRPGPGHLHLTWRHHPPPLTLTLMLMLYFSDLTDGAVCCMLAFYTFSKTE